MKFERDDMFSLAPLVDDKGRHYSEQDNGFIDFGGVSHQLMSKQSQYGSRYVDGTIEGYPNLGNGLRFQGDPADYHSLGIHPDDIDEFIRRYHTYQAFKLGYVEDDEGNVHEIDEDVREGIRVYLDSVGAFDTKQPKSESA